MAITEGNWVQSTFLSTSGVTIAATESVVDEIIAAILACDGGWSIATPSTQYATNGGVWARLTHSAGPSVILAALINASSPNTTVIDAANIWDGVSRNPQAGTHRGKIFISWNPSGVLAPTNDPSNATFFNAATDYRFQLLHPNTDIYTNAQRRFQFAGQSDGSLFCWSQVTPATATSIQSWWCGASDLFVALRQAGDTNGSGMLTVGATGSGVDLAFGTTTLVGQCLKASGSARAGVLTNWGSDVTQLGATVQLGSPYCTTEITAFRANADVSTTGIINGNGVKGAINPYALRFLPTSLGTKAVLDLGNYVTMTGGYVTGWKSTNGTPS